MKYQPPFEPGAAPAAPGIFNSNANAPYVNGDPATAVEGSIPPAAAFEHDQRELVHLIMHSGQAPSHTDLEQVRKAIRKMIDTEVQIASVGGGLAIYQDQTPGAVHRIRSLLAGTGITIDVVEQTPGSGSHALRISSGGGGGGGGDVTQWQRLPIFPEIETANGTLAIVDNGNGTLTVSASQNILWRGWDRVSTDSLSAGARTVAIQANKTYHLRWVRGGASIVLKDLADIAYNPAAAAETGNGFDSSYDDMLIARVVTNGSNVATVVPLRNRNRLALTADVVSTNPSDLLVNGASGDVALTYNWARTPTTLALTQMRSFYEGSGTAALLDSDFIIQSTPGAINALNYGTATSRYGVFARFMNDMYGDGGVLDVYRVTAAA
jgi:hypothetical protein